VIAFVGAEDFPLQLFDLAAEKAHLVGDIFGFTIPDSFHVRPGRESVCRGTMTPGNENRSALRA
jgi:hypothetical protein